MPTALLVGSDTESVAGDVTPTKADPTTQADQELADAVNDNAAEEEEDDDDDDDEADGEVYVVEAILDHRADFDDGTVRYQVKWKGYEKKSERTWEAEDSFIGARAILEAYWEKLGGKPVPADAKPASKKRGRQSAGGSGTPDSTAIKKQKKSVGRKSKDGGASISNFQEEDTTPDVPYGFTEVGADNWKVPKIANGAWDQAVHAVDTIEKDDQGELWAYLVWNDQNEDGRYYRSKAKLATCNKCCPQRMLQFYEKHVVFTNSRNTFIDNNGDTT